MGGVVLLQTFAIAPSGLFWPLGAMAKEYGFLRLPSNSYRRGWHIKEKVAMNTSQGTLPQAMRLLEIISEHELTTKETQALIAYLPALAVGVREKTLEPVSCFRRQIGIDPPIDFIAETAVIDFSMSKEAMTQQNDYNLQNHFLNFPILGEGRVEFEFSICWPKRNCSAEAVKTIIAEIDRKNVWMPACFVHVLFFLPIYRKKRFGFPLQANGQSGRCDDASNTCQYYPFITSSNVSPAIALVMTGIDGEGTRYLCVREKNNS